MHAIVIIIITKEDKTQRINLPYRAYTYNFHNLLEISSQNSSNFSKSSPKKVLVTKVAKKKTNIFFVALLLYWV